MPPPLYTALDELLGQLKRRRLSAEAHGTPEAVRRADLRWAAVAIHACDVAHELGLTEPPRLRQEATALIESTDAAHHPQG